MLFNCSKQNLRLYVCYIFVPGLIVFTLLKKYVNATNICVGLHINWWIFLPCIWKLKAPFPTRKVFDNDRHQNEFLAILQFHQCFPYQTSWRERTLARMSPWSVTPRLIPHPSTTGQRREGTWSSRVSETTICHDFGNVTVKLRGVFLRKQRLVDSSNTPTVLLEVP